MKRFLRILRAIQTILQAVADLMRPAGDIADSLSKYAILISILVAIHWQ